jgi:amino acid adenylation domain-containing protein
MKLYTKFLERVQKCPEATALIYGEKSITYRVLDRLSSELAESVKANGFLPGQRAAIYLEKTIESVVCMLATLKAGGIYIPMDYGQPYKRVSYILDNCKISLLFTREEKAGQLGNELTPPDTLESLVTLRDTTTLPSFFHLEKRLAAHKASPNPEDLVFLLYTSGSTGVPKGVKISCQNALVFVDWCLEEMDIRATDTLLNLAGFHFDLSVFDIFATLSTGARLVVSPDAAVMNPFEICKTIAKHSVTALYCVPSILVLLLASGAACKHDLSSLRYVLFAGETFPLKYLKALKALLPQASLYNLYGPTETNVCSYFKVEEIPEDRTEPVPIGRAVSGASLYALNEKGEPIQGDEMGELYVTGPCVTPGYWNYQDARNAENHKKNIHATGDLVSLEGTNFVFRGRKDNQVKLKGYRIELDEIESVLIAHPDVKECAVVVVDKEENPRLTAYIVPVDNKTPTASEIREYCARYLVKYMIPPIVKIMDSLPKNANGKIDKIKLLEG